jgi:hypothetical protein
MGTFGKLKFPWLSVLVVRVYSLTGLVITTVAPGTTAPDGSVTTPVTDELPEVWARAWIVLSAKQKIATQTAAADLRRMSASIFFWFEVISSPIL